MFTIIEDNSPYYIRFTHDGIENIIDYCNSIMPDISNLNGQYIHYRLNNGNAEHLVTLSPVSKFLPVNKSKVSFFISKPGLYYRAHKDGLVNRFAINYCCNIKDDKCITSWYSDEDLSIYGIDKKMIDPSSTKNLSRECLNFNKSNHKPLTTMIARQGEAVLFNTDIFHDWDNTQSLNNRVILTLRLAPQFKATTYFADAKDILFNQKTINDFAPFLTN